VELSPRDSDRRLAQAALVDAARAYAAASKAPNTVRAYRSDLRDFEEWCAGESVAAIPAAPATIALYLTALARAGAKASTLQRRVSALSQAHQLAGYSPSPTADPVVRATMAGIRRAHGTAPAQKTALLTAELRRLLAATDPASLAGARDRALLLLGFSGGFRRGELVSLNVEDLEETEDGLRVQLRRGKTDQEGQGREVGIPRGRHPDTCPVRALQAWRSVAGIADGSLFRPVNRHGVVSRARLSDRGVARIVQRAAGAAGLDPALYAGHSLRAGLATAAAAGGASERAIMAQTGHRSVTMVRRYIRSGSLFTENAAAYVGL
jgi:site-specific recombinase XerD